MCGKNLDFSSALGERVGSPPRVREKLDVSYILVHFTRITPACAGKTTTLAFASEIAWDHPRVCGKNSIWMRQTTLHSGSPPRVREKQRNEDMIINNDRITPACAGKTLFLSTTTYRLWDHPRVCGKNLQSKQQTKNRPGSPPRVREKR